MSHPNPRRFAHWCPSDPHVCRFWTYGTDFPNKGVCWLKTAGLGHEPQLNRDSGEICGREAVTVNLTEPACAGCAETTKFLYKQAYHGPDLIEGGIPDVGSAADCCSQCREHLGCRCDFPMLALLCSVQNDANRFWTYGTDFPNKGVCWLKSSGVVHTPQLNRDSVEICERQNPNATEPGCAGCLETTKFLEKQDYQGMDLIGGGIRNVGSSTECYSQCKEHLACRCAFP